MEDTPAYIQNITLAGLNLIKQALSIYDKDLRLVVANQRFQRMFRLPDELTQAGAPFADTIRLLVERGEYGVIDDPEAFIAERVAIARTFEPHYLERSRPNGTTISIEGSPLRQGGWVAVYTDITELKQQAALLRDRSADLSGELLARSEELSQTNRELTATITALEEAKRELTASQEQLSLVNAMTPAHIARVDRRGVYSYSNNKLGSLLPDQPNEVVGKHFREALGDQVYAEVAPAFERTLSGEAPVIEFEVTNSGRHIRVALTPDVATNGTVQGAYLLSMDVTDEVSARRALTHTHRRELAAQLTSGLAHDFSNLLTIIMGQNDRLERLGNQPDGLFEIAATIKSAAKRGGALLEGLSQIDAKRVLQIRATEVGPFLRNLSRLAQAAVPDEITLHINNDLSATYVMLDPGFAQDALLNLVLNAVEAMDGPGEILLDLSHRGNALEFAVCDTGPGFTEHALANALAPFYTSKVGKLGRGLGLSAAFDFAKTSGGTMRLANAETGGARVSMRIPFEEAKPMTPGMVLLVEDTVEIRETVRGYLRHMGHAVIEADNADEAITLAQIPEVTHIVTDLILGDGPTGHDFARAVRAKKITTSILVITGLDPDDARCKAAADEFSVLKKPFDHDALAARLAKG